MPVLAYGTSVPTPAPPPPLYRPWTGIDGMTWTGWDGSVWDLLSLTSGVVLLNDDVRGLGTPEFTHHTSQAHGVPGARWRGRAVQRCTSCVQRRRRRVLCYPIEIMCLRNGMAIAKSPAYSCRLGGGTAGGVALGVNVKHCPSMFSLAA